MDTKNEKATPERAEQSTGQALSAPPGSVSVPLKLLEELIEIACDYINPGGEKHHGVPPFNHGEACRVIREAGDIRDNFEYECRHCGIFHDRDDSFCKPNAERTRGANNQ